MRATEVAGLRRGDPILLGIAGRSSTVPDQMNPSRMKVWPSVACKSQFGDSGGTRRHEILTADQQHRTDCADQSDAAAHDE